MPAHTAHQRFTTRADGDLAVSSVGVEARRAATVDLPWTWLHQVHGADVVTVTEPGEHAGSQADAAVTATPGAVLAVQVADCAPVVLLADGVIGVAHAGWRGIVAGVLPATVSAMRALGAGAIDARLGPCVHAGCYEFGAAALGEVEVAVGATVAGRTSGGSPSLDVPAAVVASLAPLDVAVDRSASVCTACRGDLHWSHRARAEQGRQAALAWLV